jgi:hypothetical protein
VIIYYEKLTYFNYFFSHGSIIFICLLLFYRSKEKEKGAQKEKERVRNHRGM